MYNDNKNISIVCVTINKYHNGNKHHLKKYYKYYKKINTNKQIKNFKKTRLK